MIVLDETSTCCQDHANAVWFAALDKIKKYWFIHLSNALFVLKSVCFYSLWLDNKFRYNDVESYNFVIVHILLRIYLHSITIIILRFRFKFPLERVFAYIITSILIWRHRFYANILLWTNSQRASERRLSVSIDSVS